MCRHALPHACVHLMQACTTPHARFSLLALLHRQACSLPKLALPHSHLCVHMLYTSNAPTPTRRCAPHSNTYSPNACCTLLPACLLAGKVMGRGKEVGGKRKGVVRGQMKQSQREREAQTQMCSGSRPKHEQEVKVQEDNVATSREGAFP